MNWLPIEIALLQLVVQSVLWALGRGLGRPLHRAAIVCGLLAPWVLLAPWLFGDRLLVPVDFLSRQVPDVPQPLAESELRYGSQLSDPVLQFLPWELEVRHALAARRLPLWSDLLDGGSSPWSNPQAGVLSPIAALARVVPIQHFLLAELVLKLTVACEGLWVLARMLGAGSAAASLAGLGYAGSGALVAWGLFPHSAAAAWLPWLVAGTVRLLRRPDVLALIATSLIAAAVLLSGQPEVAAAAAGLALFLGGAVRRRSARAVRRGLLHAGAAALLGACLAAPLLLPFARLLPHTQRAQEHMQRVLPAIGGWSEPASWFVERKGSILLAPLNPYVFGLPYGGVEKAQVDTIWPIALLPYASLAVIFGAVAALASRRRRKRALVLWTFAAVVLLLGVGFLPLARLLWIVPPLRLPEYARFEPAAVAALCAAAALGLDAVLRAGRRRALGLVFLIVAAASLALRWSPLVAGAWALLALFVALAPRWRRAALGAAIAALALDLVPWGRTLLPRGQTWFFYPPSPVLTATRVAAGDGRAVGLGNLVFPSLLPVYGLAEVRPHNPLAPAGQVEALGAAFGYSPSTQEYFASFDHPDHPLLRFLGVRVVVSNLYLQAPRTLVPVDPEVSRLYRLYRVPDPLPRWFLATGADVMPRAAVASWIAAMKSPSRVALCVEEVGDWRPPERALDTSLVNPIASTPGRARLRVGGEGERLLATSLPGPFGWQARAGGAGLRTVTVDAGFLGVVLPAGVSEVDLRYVPPGLRLGTALCSLGLVALVGLGVGAVRERR
ncbi:MAG: YfhO family protein [Acidobacteriota bacterium]